MHPALYHPSIACRGNYEASPEGIQDTTRRRMTLASYLSSIMYAALIIVLIEYNALCAGYIECVTSFTTLLLLM
jgi:hypothetical protein